MAIRPRRSVLYMPGSNLRALAKARTLPADAVILDLEDAVAPQAKPTAREQVAAEVRSGGFGNREVIIRINALDTVWGGDDLSAATAARPDAILVPKISRPDDLRLLDDRLGALAADPKIRVWTMIETPLAVLNAGPIAATSQDRSSRIAAFVMGTNDLAKETRARLTKGRTAMVPWLMTCIAAARAYGLDILDGVFNDIADIDGFVRECAQARDLGFDGKTLIHPGQIEPCNAAFSPSADELAEARRIIAAFDLPENLGKGVVQLDGRMVERMHADIARRIVLIGEAIAGL